MLPYPTIANRSNVGACHLIASREMDQWNTTRRTEPTDRAHVVVSQLSPSVIGSAQVTRSSFRFAVMDVLNCGAGDKMARIATRRVIARMPDIIVGRKLAYEKLIGKTVRADVALVDVDVPIPSWPLLGTKPRPACVRAAGSIKSREKSVSSPRPFQGITSINDSALDKFTISCEGKRG